MKRFSSLLKRAGVAAALAIATIAITSPSRADGWVLVYEDLNPGDPVPTWSPLQTYSSSGNNTDIAIGYTYVVGSNDAASGIIGGIVVNGFVNGNGSASGRIAYGLGLEGIWSGTGRVTSGCTFTSSYSVVQAANASSTTGNSTYVNTTDLAAYAPRATGATASASISHSYSPYRDSDNAVLTSTDLNSIQGSASITTNLAGASSDARVSGYIWVESAVATQVSVDRYPVYGHVRFGYANIGGDCQLSGGGTNQASAVYSQTATASIH